MTKFEMNLRTDKFGNLDNSMFLRNKKNKKKILIIKKMKKKTKYKECICLVPGNYKFQFFDSRGDGFLKPGFLKVYLDGKRKFSVNWKKDPWDTIKETLKIN